MTLPQPLLVCVFSSDLGRETTEEAKPEVHHGEGKVLVEEVAEETAHAQVGPAAVDQQQALEEAELGEGVVTGENGLDPLLPGDADTDMSTSRRDEGEKPVKLGFVKLEMQDSSFMQRRKKPKMYKESQFMGLNAKKVKIKRVLKHMHQINVFVFLNRKYEQKRCIS